MDDFLLRLHAFPSMSPCSFQSPVFFFFFFQHSYNHFLDILSEIPSMHFTEVWPSVPRSPSELQNSVNLFSPRPKSSNFLKQLLYLVYTFFTNPSLNSLFWNTLEWFHFPDNGGVPGNIGFRNWLDYVFDLRCTAEHPANGKWDTRDQTTTGLIIITYS